MKLDAVVQTIQGTVLTTFPYENIEVKSGLASDLMSDVLVLAEPQTLLITGLTNPQSVRTAEMSDIIALLFVRGKHPQPQTIELAEETGIVLVLSPYTMYETCGLLYAAGLEGQGKVAIVHQR